MVAGLAAEYYPKLPGWKPDIGFSDFILVP
jgi:hypothetical protein